MIYKSDAREAAFLLGGIGTGTISVGSRGEFKDWEIFNKPAKGSRAHYSFFSIRMQTQDGKKTARILESKILPPYTQAHGYHPGHVSGLPHMDSSTLKGEYPFVQVNFEDDELPVKVDFEAFTPFIPLNANDSGIPGAVIRYRVRNTHSNDVDVSIAGSMLNLAGFKGYDAFDNIQMEEGAQNEYRIDGSLRGIFFTSSRLQKDQLKYGSMALMTPDENVTVKANWLDGGWWDGIQDFWEDFSNDGRLEPESKYLCKESVTYKSASRIGSLGIFHTLKPGEVRVFEFFLAWYFPNRVKGWFEDGKTEDCPIEKNYYSRLFSDAWQAGKYLAENIECLEKGSRDFHRALFGSTLPPYVIDALACNITVIRSNTCFRIEDGTFLAFEGCHDNAGSCEGTCTHVWNYAQTLAFLFPELEQSAREVEFNLETDEKGRMAFRTWQIFGSPKHDMLPAADGQLGTVVRLYREWKLSGNTGFLKRVWKNASKALDFAFTYWDSDGDFVLDSRQHNTYDIEFYGLNSLTNTMFYAALKAGAEMAEYLGDMEHAEKYRTAFEKGSKLMDELLWDGEYYIQKIDDVNKYRYQYGTGCLSDQLLGQLLSHVAGLGYLLPQEHVRKAVESIFRYNFYEGFKNVNNVQRAFALNDERGLVVCSWPKGGRPALPLVYSDEVWSGIEYQMAAHLIYEGFVAEGLYMVKAVRERQDGYRRNPWDEVECGHHYARSLASWAVLLALCGFKCDLVKGTMSFKPVINRENFSAFWSNGKAWGIYKQCIDPETGKMYWNIDVLYGDAEGIEIN